MMQPSYHIFIATSAYKVAIYITHEAVVQTSFSIAVTDSVVLQENPLTLNIPIYHLAS